MNLAGVSRSYSRRLPAPTVAYGPVYVRPIKHKGRAYITQPRGIQASLWTLKNTRRETLTDLHLWDKELLS